MYLSASFTEAASGASAAARGLRRATKGKRVDGAVVLGKERELEEKRRERRKAPPEVVVMASGNLGLVSFPQEPGRVTLERIDELFPDLVPTLRSHPGVGFVLVRSASRGAVVLGPGGAHYLDEGLVQDEDPLAPFGATAPAKVRRTDGFANCPDLVVNGAYYAQTNEVAAFEELVGSHGGMGGEQAHAFLLAPSDFAVPEEPLLGAGAVHVLLRRWLADLGQDGYRAPHAPVSAAAPASIR